jgi:hypothetical protein
LAQRGRQLREWTQPSGRATQSQHVRNHENRIRSPTSRSL